MSTVDVSDWMTAKTFRPRLVVTSRSSGAVVAAVSRGLQHVGYAVRSSSPAETRLRYGDWFAVASGKWESTEVVIVATDDSSVLIEVTRGAENRKGRKLGRQALNTSLESLLEQGDTLVVGPWHKAP